MTNKYKMSISRMTVDKLGVKLYDRVSAVIAELVANSYDADATLVTIEAPMGQYLATTQQGKNKDSGYKVVVSDNGIGMEPDVINTFYLKVGGERRKDVNRGERSKKFSRRVMGRKGVGKLAPFGICGTIEVLSSGGSMVDGIDEFGKPSNGYKTAHFIMVRDKILSDEDSDYSPDLGPLDETVQPTSGTTLIMTNFIRRMVPNMQDFDRQLSQRFGLRSADWRVCLTDSMKLPGAEGREAQLGDFSIETMSNTQIKFEGPDTESVDISERTSYRVVGPDNQPITSLDAGFVHSGRFYPITGWVAYARQSYRDDLMAGVRIYCRGKIAAQTSVFNRKSGFTGEYQVRSYLVGELQADWLDQEEDLIQTDRRDILWSDDLGQAFEEWGRKVVQLLGTITREPVKRKAWEEFLDAGRIQSRVEVAYPGERWKAIRETTMKIAKLLGERLRDGEVNDPEHVESLVQLSLMLGPHVQLDDALRDAASETNAPLAVVTKILRTARVAELSSFGMIAERRVQVIEQMMKLKDVPETLEQALQNTLEEAPWLINPQWSPITANQSLTTLKEEFEKFFERETGIKITLNALDNGNKRPDFVLSSHDYGLQIIEIKKPVHKLKNVEWDRVQTYIDVMTKFLDLPGNQDFKRMFRGFTVTLVCDEISLSGSQDRAFKTYVSDRTVEHITWAAFLRRTQHMHQEFLKEAERQRSLAVTE